MTNQNRPSFNTIPHYIPEDYRGGKLNINQLRVLLWLRAIGTPYGKATTSLNDLKHDVFPYEDLKINTINSILLKLRQKQHIYFEPRQGKAGTFDVKLNHWPMPNKGYQILDGYFANDNGQNSPQKTGPDDTHYPQSKPSEDHQKLEGQNQKLQEMKSGLIKGMSVDSQPRQIRTYHNENDTEHQIENHDNVVKTFNGTSVRDFQPQSWEEERCMEIASAVGEQFINPLRSVLRKDGFRIIEQAYGVYREDRAAGKRIDDSPAYFYGIIKKLREQR